jgi:hypothetical protein
MEQLYLCGTGGDDLDMQALHVVARAEQLDPVFLEEVLIGVDVALNGVQLGFRYSCPHHAQRSGVHRSECLPVVVQVGCERDVEDPHGLAVPDRPQVWLGLGVGDRGLALLVGVVALARIRAGGA